jgi:kynurenine formamidase
MTGAGVERPGLAALPRYDELAVIERTGARHAWGVFGDQDELGTLNFIRPEVVAAAAREVVAGEVVNLDLPLDQPDPPLVAGRHSFKHGLRVERWGRDDWLDNFYLQGSSQWDSLQHFRYREFGYYGGRQEADLDGGALAVDRLARRGIISRGVLVDVAAYLAARGTAVEATARFPIGPDLIEASLSWERVEVRSGDVLLVRTGWLAWYLGLDRAGREALAGSLHTGPGGLNCPGLSARESTAAWLWDRRVAAVAADNPALEVLPVDPAEGYLHRLLIPLLGMPIGEFWDLEGLSEACRRHQRYTCLLTSAPLYLRGGVGSPANAYAVL